MFGQLVSMSLRKRQNSLYESVHVEQVHVLKQLVSHHVCDTSQLFHLLPRQKAGIKAGAVAATPLKDVVCSLSPVRRKGFIRVH